MTDMLFFLSIDGRRLHQAGWTGPWPPPERLLMLVGEATGIAAVIVEEAFAPPEFVAAARELGSITESRWQLRNASTIPEAAPEGAHWFRGAEYVPETDDA